MSVGRYAVRLGALKSLADRIRVQADSFRDDLLDNERMIGRFGEDCEGDGVKVIVSLFAELEDEVEKVRSLAEELHDKIDGVIGEVSGE